MPSASNLRLASSSAQVWILRWGQASVSESARTRDPQAGSASRMPLLSSPNPVAPLPTKPKESCTPPGPGENTYELSGLNAYATTASAKLPKNPYTHTPSHPSFLYFSPGGIPNSHPPGGS